MQFPKLTPLQSRLVACLCTSTLCVLVYYLLSPAPARYFAYAAELDSLLNQDHNHHRILGAQGAELLGDSWGEEGSYEAEFVGVSRSLIGRADDVPQGLKNNVPETLNIDPGDTKYYVFEKADIFGKKGSNRKELPSNLPPDNHRTKRDDSEGESLDAAEHANQTLERRQDTSIQQVYISINTCLQPTTNATVTAYPQLSLYISTVDTNQKPGPGADDSSQTMFQLDGGYMNVTINVTDNVYIGIAAPKLDLGFTGSWNYEIAASIDAFFMDYFETPFLWKVDSDSNSALLATMNLTSENVPPDNVTAQTKMEHLRQKWMGITPPFELFVFNQSDPAAQALKRSYCGLKKMNLGAGIDTNMTRRGMGQNPKQQFHVKQLKPGQKYLAILGYNGVKQEDEVGSAGGGGRIWETLSFETQRDGNCRIIFDLPFCNDVAYAVPTNPTNDTLKDMQNLVNFYDEHAKALYQNFTFSLQQIPCDTTSSAQYSLVSNCEQCARSYKTWLCAVTIPRCTDFSAPNSSTKKYLLPRNVMQPFYNNDSLADLTGHWNDPAEARERMYLNSSRNPLIDSVIRPGPYKELLPCRQLCYDLVRTCPAALGFQCPDQGFMLDRSYGDFDRSQFSVDVVTCNYPGVDWPTLSGVGRVRGAGVAVAVAVGLMVIAVMEGL
ncbi:hypothetical protein EJ06DRAFT_515282 [Trichodelitschia bisporula]|uniref:FZ domain-containing protein n=1 Tax=Trichodelitschia bisporula TaxID=703511 RepID=A0A6G1HM17_9PEZI|nr:hypothetical protein EJ06DRAFT_515282 [Trichodelitschia bisporula]